MALLKRKLNHALPAFFLAAGLLMPLLGVLDPSFADPRMLIPAALVVLLFEVASINKLTAGITAGLFAAGIAAWLLAFGGITIAGDVMIALSLRISGQMAALPLMACGYTPEEARTASPRDMDRYYSPEVQRQWGVVGIELSFDF